MSPRNENVYHGLFEAGVIIKIFDAATEIISGAFLALVTRAEIRTFVISLTSRAFPNLPVNILWDSLNQTFSLLGNYSQAFWAAIFLAHGIVKLFLAIGLIKDKLWTYPTSVVAFSLFAAYQIWQIATQPSLLLALVTAYDVALIFLIVHEYRYKLKEKGPTPSGS